MEKEKNTRKILKPDFRRTGNDSAQKVEREQRTKKQLLEEIEAIRQRLADLEYYAGNVAANESAPSSGDLSRSKAEAGKVVEDGKNLLHLIFNLSTNFIYLPSDEIDSGINDVLSIVGQYSNTDRSYVFLFDKTK
jgi:hypothetical protein